MVIFTSDFRKFIFQTKHFELFFRRIEHAYDIFASEVRWVPMPQIEIVPNENKYAPTNTAHASSNTHISAENITDQNPGWMTSATTHSKKKKEKAVCSCLHESNEKITDGPNELNEQTVRPTSKFEQSATKARGAKRPHIDTHEVSHKRAKAFQESASSESESEEISSREQTEKPQKHSYSNDGDQVMNETPRQPVILSNTEQVAKLRILRSNDRYYIVQEGQTEDSNTHPTQLMSTSDASRIVGQSSGAKQPMVADKNSCTVQPTVAEEGMKFA